MLALVLGLDGAKHDVPRLLAVHKRALRLALAFLLLDLQQDSHFSVRDNTCQACVHRLRGHCSTDMSPEKAYLRSGGEGDGQRQGLWSPAARHPVLRPTTPSQDSGSQVAPPRPHAGKADKEV